MGDVVFNIKPVDKTIAVKYPHFLNHGLMMSAEITLSRICWHVQVVAPMACTPGKKQSR
jgi:hypothetical protein